jgi:geranylgeranyl diphosphate synthase type II
MSNITALRKEVEDFLKAIDFDSKSPKNLYAPMGYLLSLPAKRIRPLLCLMAYEAASGKDPQPALPVAAAVELFHNFTLMHDDIMDRAPVRRGQPTVHIKWNVNTAILSGDALFAMTMGMVAGAFPEKAQALIAEYTDVAMGVCEGQMEDMDLAEETAVTIPQYIEMIRKKTAVLLGGCLTLGAIAGGASGSVIGQLREFGEKMGVAFQLQDDLMDAFPPDGFGKQVGGDIQENKKTFLLLRCYELADEAQKARLDQLLYGGTTDAEKVEGVLDLYRTLGIEAETRQLIDRYFGEALEVAGKFSGHSRFESIVQFLQDIARRSV